MNTWVHHHLLTLTHWLMPQRCNKCRAISTLLYCPTCIDALPWEPQQHLTESGITVTSLLPYHTDIQHILHALKFEGNRSLGETLAHQLCVLSTKGHLSLFQAAQNRAISIPAPSVSERNAARGFHHCEVLFGPVCQQNNLPLVPAIIRSKTTEHLHKLSKQDRWEATKEAFHVILPDLVLDKDILIVDDILTTGATIDTLAVCLMQAGARSVQGLVLATGKR